jgi:hypothetical protein
MVSRIGKRGREKGVGGELGLARQPRGNHGRGAPVSEQQQGEAPACLEGSWEGEKWSGVERRGQGWGPFYSRAGSVGGGFGQPEGELAVAVADGGARDDVGAVLGGDVGGKTSAEAWE